MWNTCHVIESGTRLNWIYARVPYATAVQLNVLAVHTLRAPPEQSHTKHQTHADHGQNFTSFFCNSPVLNTYASHAHNTQSRATHSLDSFSHMPNGKKGNKENHRKWNEKSKTHEQNGEKNCQQHRRSAVYHYRTLRRRKQKFEQRKIETETKLTILPPPLPLKRWKRAVWWLAVKQQQQSACKRNEKVNDAFVVANEIAAW